MTSKCRSSPAVGLSVQLSVLQTAGFGLNFWFIYIYIYIYIYIQYMCVCIYTCVHVCVCVCLCTTSEDFVDISSSLSSHAN